VVISLFNSVDGPEHSSYLWSKCYLSQIYLQGPRVWYMWHCNNLFHVHVKSGGQELCGIAACNNTDYWLSSWLVSYVGLDGKHEYKHV